MSNDTSLALTGPDRERALREIAKHQEIAKKLIQEALERMNDEAANVDDHAIQERERLDG